MDEIATEQDVLDKYHNAGGSGGSVPSSDQCVTKSNLTNPAGLPSNVTLTVSGSYRSDELVNEGDISFKKTTTVNKIYLFLQEYAAGSNSRQLVLLKAEHPVASDLTIYAEIDNVTESIGGALYPGQGYMISFHFNKGNQRSTSDSPLYNWQDSTHKSVPTLYDAHFVVGTGQYVDTFEDDTYAYTFDCSKHETQYN